MPKTYNNLIFTKHALERMADRSISEHAAYLTVSNPDFIEEKKGNTKYIKKIQGRNYHIVVANASEPNKKLVISTWARGENDIIPLGWQLLTAPFKIAWWFLKLALRLFRSLFK